MYALIHAYASPQGSSFFLHGDRWTREYLLERDLRVEQRF